MPLEFNSFGRAMLATGVPLTTIKAECDDPAVPYLGKAQFLVENGVEDLDSRDCLRKCTSIDARCRFTQVNACVLLSGGGPGGLLFGKGSFSILYTFFLQVSTILWK